MRRHPARRDGRSFARRLLRHLLMDCAYIGLSYCSVPASLLTGGRWPPADRPGEADAENGPGDQASSPLSGPPPGHPERLIGPGFSLPGERVIWAGLEDISR
jgi:hypothetical protein